MLKKICVCLGIFYLGIFSNSVVSAEEVQEVVHNDNTIENLEIDEEFIQSLDGEIYSNTEALPNTVTSSLPLVAKYCSSSTLAKPIGEFLQ